MGNYVVINLAEAATGGRGVTGKVRDALVSQGRTEVRTKKLMRKEKIEIVQQNTIYKFDLLAGDRKFDRTKAGIWFGLGIDVLLEMRRRCLEADRVYLCAHGSASDRNQVFYDSGMGNIKLLATVNELLDFTYMVLDPARSPYELILVICFAARSGNPDQKHTKSFLQDPANLKSSLAYRLFKKLDEERVKVRMQARLGEVRVSVKHVGGSFAYDIFTQTEEGVLAGMQMADLGRRERVLKQELTDDVMDKLRRGQREPQSQAERDWLRAIQEVQRLHPTMKSEEATQQTGSLIYERPGANLLINFQGDVIYDGAML